MHKLQANLITSSNLQNTRKTLQQATDISTNDQSVICEGSLLETIPPFQSYVSESVRFVSLIIVSRSPLGVDCHMFATCTVLYISSCCSCTDIPGACPYDCAWTTTVAALSRELENHLIHSMGSWSSSRELENPIHSTGSWPSSFLTQPRLIGLGICGCCWTLHLQMPAW